MFIDHVQVSMPPGGEDAARSFYEEVLGLTEVPKPDVLQGRGGCWFSNDLGLKIHLGVDPQFRPASKAHVALRVENLAVILAKIIAADLTVEQDVPLPGYERAFIRDPFGNRIELLQQIESP